MHASFHKSRTFSITFDGWTSIGMRYAFICITYHWVDDDFQPQSCVFDVMQMHGRHTADIIAMNLARRIDSHCTEDQVLYGQSSDNAKNVRNAATQLVEQFRQLVVDAMVNDTEQVDTILCDEQDDLMEDDSDDDGVGDSVPVSDAQREAQLAARRGEEDESDRRERLRVWRCIAHLISLSIKGAVDSVIPLVTAVDRVQSVMRAIRMSEKRQRELNAIQKQCGMKVLSPLLMVVTRWGSLGAMIQRYVDIEPAVHVLSTVYCSFDDASESITIPTAADRFILTNVAAVLADVHSVVEFVQGETYHVLPYVLSMIQRLSDVGHGLNADATPPAVSQFVAALQAQFKMRFIDLVDAASPAFLAAYVYPHTTAIADAILTDLGKKWIDKDYVVDRKPLHRVLFEWLIYLYPFEPLPVACDDNSDRDSIDDALQDETSIRLPFHSSSQQLETAKQAHKDGLISDLKLLRQALADCSERDADDGGFVAHAKVGGMTLTTFYAPLPDRIRCLVQMILSLQATSAASERVFSASGLVNGPLRSKLSPVNLERITVAYNYLSKLNDRQIELFIDEFAKRLTTLPNFP